MDIKIKVGLKIKELRKQKGLTQEQLSELTEIDRTYISDVERGLRNIAIVNLDKIAKVFDVELFELLKF
jgi:transcriptional regulator with XRE-family HTH domain